jgi:HEAT repeat protein
VPVGSLAEGGYADRLVSLLDTAEACVRTTGLAAVALLEPAGGVLDRAAALVGDTDSTVRWAALDLLRRHAHSPLLSGRHAEAVAQGLEDPDVMVRFGAIAAVGAMPLEALVGSVERLLQCLGHGQPGVRVACLLALAKLDVAVVGPHLFRVVEALADADGGVRWAALHLLGKLPQDATGGFVDSMAARLEDQVTTRTQASLRRAGGAS